MAAPSAAAAAPSESHSGDQSAPFGATTAQLEQSPPRVKLRFAARRAFDPARLSAKSGPYLCAEFDPPKGRDARTEVCIVGRGRAGGARLRAYRLTPGGRKLSGVDIGGSVRRSGKRSAAASFAPARAGLSPGELRWRLVEGTGPMCPSSERGSSGCFAAAVRGGSSAFQLRRVRVAGCRRTGSHFRRAGSRSRRLVALTFDDGPSPYTPQVLDVLRRERAHGTFFQLGKEMPGREEVMRRILREGSEIANHTFNHANLAGGGAGAVAQLRTTNARVRDATGFTPCAFRAPYNAVGGGLIAAAASQGMTTVQYDVDPSDYSNPGSGAIAGRVIGAVNPGSIVVMHDGGGHRGQTVAALPAIINALRARGYRFVTVSDILGYKPRYALE